MYKSRTLQNLKFPSIVKISAQVAFFCRLTVFILNLNVTDWLEIVWKCYLLNFKPISNYSDSIGILNTKTVTS